MEWTVEHDGEYRARFTPAEDGIVQGRRRRHGRRTARTSAAATATLRVAPSDAEYFDAAMRAPLLKRLAEETGGRFFTADETRRAASTRSPTAARASRSSKSASSGTCRSCCSCCSTLMGGEWLYRRARGSGVRTTETSVTTRVTDDRGRDRRRGVASSLVASARRRSRSAADTGRQSYSGNLRVRRQVRVRPHAATRRYGAAGRAVGARLPATAKSTS